VLAVDDDEVEYALKEYVESVIQCIMDAIDPKSSRSARSLDLCRGAQHPSVRSGHCLKGLVSQLVHNQSITAAKKASIPCRHCGMECDADVSVTHLVEEYNDTHGANYCVECNEGFA